MSTSNQNFTALMIHKIDLRFRMTELRLAFLTQDITSAEYREKIDLVIAEIKSIPDSSAND